MKILSFDVGVKNLAYCTMLIEDEKYRRFMEDLSKIKKKEITKHHIKSAIEIMEIGKNGKYGL